MIIDDYIYTAVPTVGHCWEEDGGYKTMMDDRPPTVYLRRAFS